MYSYIITIEYTSINKNGEEIQKRFCEEINSDTSSNAMQMVIGKYAWLETIDGNFFRLDFIHYD